MGSLCQLQRGRSRTGRPAGCCLEGRSTHPGAPSAEVFVGGPGLAVSAEIRGLIYPQGRRYTRPPGPESTWSLEHLEGIALWFLDSSPPPAGDPVICQELLFLGEFLSQLLES